MGNQASVCCVSAEEILHNGDVKDLKSLAAHGTGNALQESSRNFGLEIDTQFSQPDYSKPGLDSPRNGQLPSRIEEVSKFSFSSISSSSSDDHILAHPPADTRNDEAQGQTSSLDNESRVEGSISYPSRFSSHNDLGERENERDGGDQRRQ